MQGHGRRLEQTGADLQPALRLELGLPLQDDEDLGDGRLQLDAVVAVEVRYLVGSANEVKGRSGFAHLFEHLMFKGSHNVGSDEHLAMISRVGGDGNAYTTEDTTVFFETVPAEYLPLILFVDFLYIVPAVD